MCLGIPGHIEALDDDHADLADVEVAGATRKINIGILEERPAVGDWILIQAGFAIEIIDAETARTQLMLLNQYTGESSINDEPEFDWETMRVAPAQMRGDDEE
jgi:hydrogenase maturation protein HypF